MSHRVLQPEAGGLGLLLFGLLTLGVAGALRWLFAPALRDWTPRDMVDMGRRADWTGDRCDQCGVFRQDQSYYHHQITPDQTVVLCSDCYERVRDQEEAAG